MTVDSKGHGLFIVDNSVSGWTGLRYLEEWSSIAKAFDIATGYFEIGALLTLDGKWQGLDKVRILMGTETTHWTRKAILGAVRAQALDRLDESIEEDKEPNLFLHGSLGSSTRSAPGRSNAVSTARTSSTPRLTSPTQSARSWVLRRWWAPATSRGRVSRRTSS